MHARTRGVLAALVICAGLLLVGGAGTSVAANGRLDLSTRVAIDNYLLSAGVDPATVVRQKGKLNYAGPNCPGARWNCTKAKKVVQVAQPGGENRFECRREADQVPPTDPDTNMCVLVQTGNTNRAQCSMRDTEEPLAVQTCVIGQMGVRNFAAVDLVIIQTTGPEQEGQQTATVDQLAEVRNESQIREELTQRTSMGTEQTQDGFQVAEVQQFATGSDNFSHVHQSQDQSEGGDATSQFQNTNPIPAAAFNCGAEKPTDPNQCADVLQNSFVGGNNASHLHQAIAEDQTTSAMSASQAQGSFAGGQEGNIHQTNPPDVGKNLDAAHEDLGQRQSGPESTAQSQLTDPGCCGLSQVGGANNREDINQSTAQSASEGTAAFQFAELFGQAHQTSGDIDLTAQPTQLGASDGTCSIDHHGRNNSDAAHFSVSGSGAECTNLTLDTVCASGSETSGTCEPGGIGLLSFTSRPAVLSEPMSATYGLPIEMPTFAEPADYLAAIGSG